MRTAVDPGLGRAAGVGHLETMSASGDGWTDSRSVRDKRVPSRPREPRGAASRGPECAPRHARCPPPPPPSPQRGRRGAGTGRLIASRPIQCPGSHPISASAFRPLTASSAGFPHAPPPGPRPGRAHRRPIEHDASRDNPSETGSQQPPAPPPPDSDRAPCHARCHPHGHLSAWPGSNVGCRAPHVRGIEPPAGLHHQRPAAGRPGSSGHPNHVQSRNPGLRAVDPEMQSGLVRSDAPGKRADQLRRRRALRMLSLRS